MNVKKIKATPGIGTTLFLCDRMTVHGFARHSGNAIEDHSSPERLWSKATPATVAYLVWLPAPVLGRASDLGHTSINCEFCTCRKTALVAGEEQGCCRDLFRQAHASKRDHAGQCISNLL